MKKYARAFSETVYGRAFVMARSLEEANALLVAKDWSAHEDNDSEGFRWEGDTEEVKQ